MSDIAHLGRKISSFRSTPEFDGYTRVVITVSEDLEYTAGVETGRTLSLECPWGTQAMADDLLTNIRGFQYQPYTASGALLDPAAELGDGVTVNNAYGGIYTLSAKFGSLYRAEVSAPAEEELDHEYPFVPKRDRKITRQLYSLSTELKVQAGLISAEIEERKTDMESVKTQLTLQSGQIAAKVSKTGGDMSSFGWDMSNTYWQVQADGSTVFKIDKYGADVRGKITALSGKIGGFDILSDYLSYNGQTWGGTNTYGAYLGTSGIQMGKNFKVDMAGNLEAFSGTFHGYVKAGRIEYGGDSGYFSGSGLSSHSINGSRLVYNTVSTAYTSGGINTSLAYADYAYGVFNGWNEAGNLFTGKLKVTGSCEMFGHKIGMKTTAVTTPGGGSKTIYYLGYD